jgi:uncharacterized membrane protein YqjE
MFMLDQDVSLQDAPVPPILTERIDTVVYRSELQEQKAPGLRTMVWTWLALLAGLMLVIGASALVLVLLWNICRLRAIVGLCGLYGIALLFFLWRLRAALKAASTEAV